MLAYLSDLMTQIQFPKEAVAYFLELAAGLDEEDLILLEQLKKRLFVGKVMDRSLKFVMQDVRPGLNAFAEKKQWHQYAADMLLVLLCTQQIEENYSICGYSREFFLENMSDLRNKLIECKKMYGLWGTSTFGWFYRLIRMTTMMLGRFQYEYIPFRFPDYTFDDMTVKTGDMVYNIHIPSAGPMPWEVRLDSYRRLFDFVKTPDTKWIPITCSSWLLYPDNREIYRPDSNLMGFLKDFHIISRSEPAGDNPFPDAWRVFYKDYTGDVSVLPADTSLQRSYIQWLSQGGKVGGGTGILLFDGENIINQ